MSTASWIYAGLLVIGIVLLVCYHRTGKMLQCIFFTAFTGIGALGAMWVVDTFLYIPITFTPLTLLISGILGIPGVAGMLLVCLL